MKRKKIRDFSKPQDEEEEKKIKQEQEAGGARSIIQKAKVVKTKKRPKDKPDPKEQITKAAEAGLIPPEQAENLLTQLEVVDEKREPQPQFKESTFSVEGKDDFLGIKAGIRGIAKNISLPLVKALGIGTDEQIADAERQLGANRPFWSDPDSLNAAMLIASVVTGAGVGVKLAGGLARSVAPTASKLMGVGRPGIVKAAEAGRLARITRTVSRHDLNEVTGKLMHRGSRQTQRAFFGKETTTKVVNELSKMSQFSVGRAMSKIGSLAWKNKGKVALGYGGITGAQIAFAYFGADNIITAQDIMTRDLTETVVFGKMSPAEAAPFFDDCQIRVNRAQRTLKILGLNPGFRIIGGGILLTNAESVTRNINIRRNLIGLT